jgi:hypothetical protein
MVFSAGIQIREKEAIALFYFTRFNFLSKASRYTLFYQLD